MSATGLEVREFPGSPERVFAWCAGVAALSIAVRALVSVQDTVVFADGPRFIAVAQSLLAGDYGAIGRDDFHPLTSVLMALGTLLLGLELETSGRVLSVLAGGAASVAVFLLARDQFGSRLAAVASLLFAIHPRLVSASASVQSDGIYIMLALFSAVTAFRLLDRGGVRWACLTGLLCGLAFLARPEGLVIAVVVGIWLGVDLLWGRLAWRKLASSAGGFSLGLLILGGPFLVAVSADRGEFVVSPKKSIEQLLRIDRVLLEDELPAGERLERAGDALDDELTAARRALNAAFIVLLVLGVRRGPLERRTLYVASYLGLMFWLLFGLALTSGYTSGRHWLTSVALLLPFAARGLLGLLEGIRSRVPDGRWRSAVVPGALAILVAGFLAHALAATEDPSKVARKEAALWLREHREPGVVGGVRLRVAYYAGATRGVFLGQGENKQALLEQARARGVDYLVIEETWLAGREVEGLRGVALLHREPYPDGSVLVFELRSAPDPGASRPAAP